MTECYEIEIEIEYEINTSSPRDVKQICAGKKVKLWKKLLDDRPIPSLHNLTLQATTCLNNINIKKSWNPISWLKSFVKP